MKKDHCICIAGRANTKIHDVGHLSGTAQDTRCHCSLAAVTTKETYVQLERFVSERKLETFLLTTL
jgi:hypothetical protein